MGRSVDGAKAGLVAGIPYGIILAIASYFTTLALKQVIIQALTNDIPSNSPFTPRQLYGIALLVDPIVVTIGGVLGGLVLGAIYGWAFPRLPGGRPVVKGIIFGMILWVLLSVLGGLGNIQYSLGYYFVQVGVGLGASLIFGWLLGYFYGRFSRPKELLVGPT
jgi:hypothetical protein